MLRDPTKFQSKSVRITNDPTTDASTTYFNATVNNEAVNGKFTVEVEQLGRADKYVSLPHLASTKFSTGTFHLTSLHHFLNLQQLIGRLCNHIN